MPLGDPFPTIEFVAEDSFGNPIAGRSVTVTVALVGHAQFGVLPDVHRAHLDRAVHVDVVRGVRRNPQRPVRRHDPGGTRCAHRHRALDGEQELRMAVAVRGEVKAAWIDRAQAGQSPRRIGRHHLVDDGRVGKRRGQSDHRSSVHFAKTHVNPSKDSGGVIAQSRPIVFCAPAPPT
mgnify:CR=1 FL=1